MPSRKKNTRKVERTNREFEVLNFKDYNGIDCSIQQSSGIDFNTPNALVRPGSSLLWLGCNDADPKILVPGEGWKPVDMPSSYIANTRMHLSREQVRELIKSLQRWLESGKLSDV